MHILLKNIYFQRLLGSNFKNILKILKLQFQNSAAFDFHVFLYRDDDKILERQRKLYENITPSDLGIKCCKNVSFFFISNIFFLF